MARTTVQQHKELPLLSLHGRIDHLAIEKAVADITSGAYRGWRVVRDGSNEETVGTPWLLVWLNFLLNVTTHASSEVAAQTSIIVRTIVLEYGPTGYIEELRFQNLGHYNGFPLWLRLE